MMANPTVLAPIADELPEGYEHISPGYICIVRGYVCYFRVRSKEVYADGICNEYSVYSNTLK